MLDRPHQRKAIAVVGTGIAGMSAAWLLSQAHDVTVYEAAARVGGHSNTVRVQGDGRAIDVDTGFIVYNEATYPNLVALFAHLGVVTQPSTMSFAVSLAGGLLEYSGNDLAGLFAQKRNIVRPRFWAMLRDLQRFYRQAPRDLAGLEESQLTLGAYLDQGGYGAGFREDHLLPMGGAIWSAPARSLIDYPAAAFIRFYENHGLLKLRDRPVWRTVVGGSQSYVARLTDTYRDRIQLGAGATAIAREEDGVRVRDARGQSARFDDVVLATHADQALALLDGPTQRERHVLGAFRYSRNRALLHSDPRLMPRRRAAWASWNYLCAAGGAGEDCPTVTYWMNALQNIAPETPLFVTLNPPIEPRDIWHSETYEHPVFDLAAMSAQKRLWSLQGEGHIWFCGAYFGSGFHEDGLQAGLAVAEALGGTRRPWNVPNESGRIVLAARDPLHDHREHAA